MLFLFSSKLFTKFSSGGREPYKIFNLLNKNQVKVNYQTNIIIKRLQHNKIMEKSQLLEQARSIIPILSKDLHKGQYGRIGVIGGSIEYTGAPYFAAISALKIGADLVHIFCPKQAGSVIKSYSPELIVHPVLDEPDGIVQIEKWLPNLHSLVIGSGLGREPYLLELLMKIINMCKDFRKPIIFDADALFFINNNIELIENYPNCILTPNRIEFQRLFGTDNDAIDENIKSILNILGDGITILEKGSIDRFYYDKNHKMIELNNGGGSGRRCGGQGDLLAGAMAIFYLWAIRQESKITDPALIASFASCLLTKKCNEYAFKLKGRSMTVTDMIEQIHYVFSDIFEHSI